MLLTNLIKSYNLFTDEEIQKIRDAFVPVSYNTYAFLLQKGETCDKIFFITEGILREFSFSNLNIYGDFRIHNVQCISPYRINGKLERSKGIFLSSSGLHNIKVWTKGAPEILVDIYAPTSSNWNSQLKIDGSADSKYKPSNRNDIKDKWWYNNSTNIDLSIFS